MNNKLVATLSFFTGTGCGIALTWKYFKTKYEIKTQEDNEAMRDAYRRHMDKQQNEERKDSTDDEKITHVVPEKVDLDEYTEIIENQGYKDYSTKKNTKKKKTKNAPPVVIDSSDFGQEDSHDCMALTYYSDKILADPGDEILDAEDVIGTEALQLLDDEDTDVVYVRNTKYKCDYEIACDPRPFAEVSSPYAEE